MNGDFRIGQWLIQPKLNDISGNGGAVHVEPKAMKVLIQLADRAGEVVEKEALIRTVWADAFVTDDVLTRSVSELRKAFHDDPREPRIIQTIPKGGYRLIAPVAGLSQSHAEADADAVSKGAGRVGAGAPSARGGKAFPYKAVATAALALIAALALPVGLNVAGLRDRLMSSLGAIHESPPQIRSLAVLPLKNLSGDPGQEYLADGMTDSVITELGRFTALRVISYRSTLQYKYKNETVPEIARELNVDAVVAGSVMQEGGRVRITARLVRAIPEQQIWTESYNRDLQDVLALEAGLASDIARQVKVAVTSQESAHLKSLRRVKPEAHQAYLRGRYFWSKRTPEGMRKGVEYFQQAIDLDPNYAPPYAGLADSYLTRAGEYLGLTDAERETRAKAAVAKALELDDSLAEAHASLAQLQVYDWRKSEREFRRALELNPSYATAHQWLSGLLLSLGSRKEEALRHAKLAVQFDPVSPIINSHLCATYYTLGDYERAIRQCQATLKLDDKQATAHFYLVYIYLAMGEKDKAADHQEQALLLSEGPSAAQEMKKRYKEEGWPGVWHWDIARAPQRRDAGMEYDPIGVAEDYVHLGDNNGAIRTLQKGYETRYPGLMDMAGDPVLRPLRSDPRFQDLLRRMDLTPEHKGNPRSAG
jgi:TolB-like protein/DNA-binding winged helix-turn-helix (wHTH) protein/Tfp pilus assembly protein PilF